MQKSRGVVAVEAVIAGGELRGGQVDTRKISSRKRVEWCSRKKEVRRSRAGRMLTQQRRLKRRPGVVAAGIIASVSSPPVYSSLVTVMSDVEYATKRVSRQWPPHYYAKMP